ncbi:M15 family metallopeptidase [Bacillus sp. JJ722]|uniref:M15 family metallopeptidase n=1 Tax=Bacillus sp. JJ722 TaxID=3122973 RepID=UPI002FFF8A36
MSVTKTCRDVNELKPVAKQACLLFLEECKKAGLDVFITETYRSQARQNYLYEQGRTRPGQKVTWTRSSNHTGRMAWDIAVNPPKNLYDATTLKKAGAIAKRLGITWGGDWDTPDMPHFQASSSWKVPSNYKPANETSKTNKKPNEKEGIRMFVPSNDDFKEAFIRVCKRLEDKKVHGEKALSPTHREKFGEGELPLDDAIAILFVAHDRGLIQGK